ncbi:hypothetical protein PMIN07_004984 [Paraphaeosphaeria minitans]
MSSMSAILERTVRFLITESRNVRTQHLLQHFEHGDSSTRLHAFRQLLCIRSPHPTLPPNVSQDIDDILLHERSRRVLTPVSSIPCVASIPRENSRPPVRIRLWKGDITTLAPGTTAITNAANSQMLGCFQPTHRCIDNVIHSWAGPRLRQECFDIASTRQNQQDALPAGDALARGSEPDDMERHQLSQCYYSVLEEADGLPETAEGKSVALCGISTGLFAFPAKLAASIAIDTVAAWFAHHPEASISDVVFVTYSEDDYETYNVLLHQTRSTWTVCTLEPAKETSLISPTMEKARTWLAEADTIIVSAGAGLSAADGLDYTSRTLFRKHFPAFLQYDLGRMYDVFGFVDWPSDRVKWGYFFTHLEMVRNWPQSQLYRRLLGWLDSFGDNNHVKTSNADGLFVANGLDEARLSTPQGQYYYLQCLANCTPDSYWPSRPFLERALPLIDPVTQSLKDDTAIPRCQNCGGDLFICVRAADWFNERPYRAGEARWQKFRRRVLSGGGGKTVVLELGVGMNTPGVLKWPNEDLVRQGNQQVKLIRLAVGNHAEVPWDLEEAELATGIDGDISVSLPQILPRALDRSGLAE